MASERLDINSLRQLSEAEKRLRDQELLRGKEIADAIKADKLKNIATYPEKDLPPGFNPDLKNREGFLSQREGRP